jgi:hypothetical protein
MLRAVVVAVQYFMTEFNGAEIVAITNIVLNLMEKMASKFCRPLKIIAFNANGIGR